MAIYIKYYANKSYSYGEIFPVDANIVRNHTHACCLNRDGRHSKVEVT